MSKRIRKWIERTQKLEQLLYRVFEYKAARDSVNRMMSEKSVGFCDAADAVGLLEKADALWKTLEDLKEAAAMQAGVEEGKA